METEPQPSPGRRRRSTSSRTPPLIAVDALHRHAARAAARTPPVTQPQISCILLRRVAVDSLRQTAVPLADEHRVHAGRVPQPGTCLALFTLLITLDDVPRSSTSMTFVSGSPASVLVAAWLAQIVLRRDDAQSLLRRAADRLERRCSLVVCALRVLTALGTRSGHGEFSSTSPAGSRRRSCSSSSSTQPCAETKPFAGSSALTFSGRGCVAAALWTRLLWRHRLPTPTQREQTPKPRQLARRGGGATIMVCAFSCSSAGMEQLVPSACLHRPGRCSCSLLLMTRSRKSSSN